MTTHTAPSDLDPTFGSAGKVTTAIGAAHDRGYSVALQSDGKIVLGGFSWNGTDYDFALVRYTTNGNLDTSFGSQGKVTTSLSGQDRGYCVTVQSDGKIILAGASDNGSGYDFAVVRYIAAGALDSSFGTNGKVVTPIGVGTDFGQSVVVQSDGKIVVAGYSLNTSSNFDFALVRYTANGVLDASFGSSGKVTTDLGSGKDDYGHAVALQSDGRIVVAGYSVNASGNSDFALIRYSTNGTLDTTFGSNGKVITDFGNGYDDYGYSLAVQSDGKILVAGNSGLYPNSEFALVRYTANGTLDAGFGANGLVITSIGVTPAFGQSVALQSDGKILLAGNSLDASGNSEFATVRYSTNGSVDSGFGTNGKVITPVGGIDDRASSVALQSDGKIVIGGRCYNGTNYDFGLVRYFGGEPLPSLAIRSDAGQTIISWTPPMSGFVLQEMLSLSSAIWTNAPTGATNPVTLPATGAAKFYRLFQRSSAQGTP